MCRRYTTNCNQEENTNKDHLAHSHLRLQGANGIHYSLLIKAATLDAPNNTNPIKQRGKAPESQLRMKVNLISFGVGLQVSRLKLFQGGRYDVGIESTSIRINGHDGLIMDKGDMIFVGEHVMYKWETIFHGLFLLDLNLSTCSLTIEPRTSIAEKTLPGKVSPMEFSFHIRKHCPYQALLVQKILYQIFIIKSYI